MTIDNRVIACRGCGADAEVSVDLGNMPAADAFPPMTEPVGAESSHGLAMALCRTCGLAQLAEDDTETDEPRAVEPEALREQARRAVADAAHDGWLTGSTVFEYPSPHGGTWLPLIHDHGFTDVMDGAPADVVVDSFGIIHEADQKAAFAERAARTAPGGTLLIQFQSLFGIIAQRQWTALRHGHFGYYSLTSIRTLLRAVGMDVTTAWVYDLYGGTIMVAATHIEHAEPDPRVELLLLREERANITDPSVLHVLQDAADEATSNLKRDISELVESGGRVYAYGAASRAVSLLCRAGVDKSLITAVADASDAKQGRRMPATDIPIISPKDLIEADPDHVLLTLPDLLPEVRRTLPELDGKWIVSTY